MNTRFFAENTLTLKKLACFTLDYELDYGGRFGTFDTLKNKSGHAKLRDFLKSREIPLSAFVQTQVLDDFPESRDVLTSLSSDFHSHSRSHSRDHFDSVEELESSKADLKKHFGVDHIGYRAPFGKLYDGDLELLKKCGYTFDSSIFPSYRPGYFNHLKESIHPHHHNNGLLEIPFAVIPKVRLILGVSWMKLFGYSCYKFFYSTFGLPEILVFYGHMHDFFPTDRLKDLPTSSRLALGRNPGQALNYVSRFFDHLRSEDYEFINISQLAEKLSSSPTESSL